MRTFEDSFSGTKIYPGKVRNRHGKVSERLQTLSWRIPSLEIPSTPLAKLEGPRADTTWCKLLGEALHPWGQQDLPFPERQKRIALPTTEEPTADRMDRSVQEAT